MVDLSCTSFPSNRQTRCSWMVTLRHRNATRIPSIGTRNHVERRSTLDIRMMSFRWLVYIKESGQGLPFYVVRCELLVQVETRNVSFELFPRKQSVTCMAFLPFRYVIIEESIVPSIRIPSSMMDVVSYGMGKQRYPLKSPTPRPVLDHGPHGSHMDRSSL